ncbi:MAG: DUF1844 domain-containing protein [Candidatus Electronema sp. V4]|uniref:DUF1844 domain-containing protein n=1 Tax=Candidatus Electronema sp. V4 TaxID=3454756 RepID=UPI00405575DE
MTEQKNDKGCPEGERQGGCVMPAVSFTSFILSLNTTALFHLGDIPHPETGRKVFDLELARHAIDTLAMLEEKTKGNLDSEEQELVSRVVYELKMRFIRVRGER